MRSTSPFTCFAIFAKKRTLSLKTLKKSRQFHCTGLLHSKLVQLRQQKNGLFYVKFNAEFNELSLFFLKAARSGQKMAKT